MSLRSHYYVREQRRFPMSSVSVAGRHWDAWTRHRNGQRRRAIQAPAPARRIGELALKHGVVLLELRHLAAGLEELFLELTSATARESVEVSA